MAFFLITGICCVGACPSVLHKIAISRLVAFACLLGKNLALGVLNGPCQQQAESHTTQLLVLQAVPPKRKPKSFFTFRHHNPPTPPLSTSSTFHSLRSPLIHSPTPPLFHHVSMTCSAKTCSSKTCSCAFLCLHFQLLAHFAFCSPSSGPHAACVETAGTREPS